LGLIPEYLSETSAMGAMSGRGTDMKCMVCKVGDTARSTVTVTLQRGNTVVIVRDAPAAVCQNCGEYSLDKATTGKLYRQGVETVR
jgi:YgiT-type zinc finger domain-containing protein